MTYIVILHRRVIKFLRKLPNAYKDTFAQLIEILKINPYPKAIFDLKKLKGSDNIYRIRLGSYRVVYAVFRNSKEILILELTTRKKAY